MKSLGSGGPYFETLDNGGTNLFYPKVTCTDLMSNTHKGAMKQGVQTFEAKHHLVGFLEIRQKV